MIRRQIWTENRHALGKRALVDDTERSGRAEHGPVRRSTQPLQVVPQELIGSGSSVSEGVGESDRRMKDGSTSLERILELG